MYASDLFASIADGPRIVGAMAMLTRVHAMTAFAASNPEARAKRQAMLNDPSLQEWLPGLGYQATTDGTTITAWRCQDHRVSAFIHSLTGCAHTTVTVPTSPLEPWPTVTQTIALADVIAALDQHDLVQRPGPLDLPTVVAFGIAQATSTSIDYPWVITADGLSRTLPPWPLRAPIDRDPRQLVLADDKHTPVPCHAWVLDIPSIDTTTQVGETIFLSIAGSAALLKMAKAQWTPRSQRLPTHTLPTASGGRMLGSVNRRAQWFSTSVGSAIHAVMLDERVVRPELPHFYHVTGPDGVPDWTLLFDQLNRALLIPLDAAMIEPLWSAALLADDGLVIPLQSYGCQGYRIHVAAVHAWAALIGQITGMTTTVTVVGADSSLAAAMTDRAA